jgi:signal peptidase I
MEHARSGTVGSWEAGLVRVTERYLTWRKKRRTARKEKQKKRNPVVDWLDAILSAVVIVLLINQYLLQAYQIPSESMQPSLLVSDRIFVNKIVYGPELVPGMLKIPGFHAPARGDVIIFESPTYLSSGPVMDILQRIVYMVTLSLVDIDKDEYGQPKHHFLIKRAIGMPGDRIRMVEGNVQFLLPGTATWTPETELKNDLGYTYNNVRLVDPAAYPAFRLAGTGEAMFDAHLTVTAEQLAAIRKFFRVSLDANGNLTGYTNQMGSSAFPDEKEKELWQEATSWAIDPSDAGSGRAWRNLAEGYYVPQGRLFPMGDNRDNSEDARYFGPVKLEKVLGKGLVRYWPLYRIGGIR